LLGALGRRHAVAPVALAAATDATARARGARLARVQCAGCHGADLAGAPISEDPWLGRLYAANLTPGRGGIAARSDADLVRAVRDGVAADGRSLLMMPSEYLGALGDADLAAILGFLRSLPPVDREWPAPRAGPLARIAIAFGYAPELLQAERALAAAARRRAPPEAAASAEYGAFLVETSGCRVCHRDDLRGGLHPLALPGEPPPPDLTPGGALAGWGPEDFERALRRGLRPDGRRLDPRFMPWPFLAALTDMEVDAIWLYLRALPAGDAQAAGLEPEPRSGSPVIARTSQR